MGKLAGLKNERVIGERALDGALKRAEARPSNKLSGNVFHATADFSQWDNWDDGDDWTDITHDGPET